MNDNELLRLAAIAGGYGHLPFVDGSDVGKSGHGTEGDIINPLTNNGDAFLLMADTKLNLVHDTEMDGSRYVLCYNVWCPKYVEGIKVPITEGVYAATRRAIVLAAAQVAIRRFDL